MFYYMFKKQEWLQMHLETQNKAEWHRHDILRGAPTGHARYCNTVMLRVMQVDLWLRNSFLYSCVGSVKMSCHKQGHHNFPFHAPLVNLETEWERKLNVGDKQTKHK